MQPKKNALENNEYIETLIEHLPMLRAQAGISQADIAEIIGIARTTYSAIENKRRRMTFPVFLSLLKYFSENEKTKKIMGLLGFTDDVLEPFFRLDSIVETKPKKIKTNKVAAFGGNISSSNDTEIKKQIEKALKELDE